MSNLSQSIKPKPGSIAERVELAKQASPNRSYTGRDRRAEQEYNAPRAPLPQSPRPQTQSRQSKHPAVKLREALIGAMSEGRINKSAFAVGMVIAHHVDKSGEAWPSNERIGVMVRLHPDNVARCKARLKAAGLIRDADVKQPRRSGGFFTANTVQVGSGADCSPFDRTDENVRPSESVGLTKTSDHNHRTREPELVKGAPRQLRIEPWPLRRLLDARPKSANAIHGADAPPGFNGAAAPETLKGAVDHTAITGEPTAQ